MQLPSPLLILCGVVLGMLVIDFQFDAPFLLGNASETDISSAYSYYTHMARLEADGRPVNFLVGGSVAVAVVCLLSQLWRHLQIEDVISIGPLMVIGLQFAEGVVEPRTELLSIPDQPLLQTPLLTTIAWSHLRICCAVIVLMLFQFGSHKSAQIRLANQAAATASANVQRPASRTVNAQSNLNAPVKQD